MSRELLLVSTTERFVMERGPGDRVQGRLERRVGDAWRPTEEFFASAGGILSGTPAAAEAYKAHLALMLRILRGEVDDVEGTALLRAAGIDPAALQEGRS